MKLGNRGTMKSTRIVLTICGFLLAIPLICVALVSALPENTADLGAWLQDSKTLLIIADEVLMFASIALLAAAVLLYRVFVPRHKTIAALGLAAWSVATVGFVIAILAIGRLIYPVNGIAVPTESLEYSIAPVFSSLHLASIALGVGIITFGFGFKKKSMAIASCIAGILQIAGTYFAVATPVWLLLAAAFAWAMWTLFVGVELKKLNTKKTTRA